MPINVLLRHPLQFCSTFRPRFMPKYLGVYHLLFVCLVDKRLNAVGTRWLYRGATLKNARQSVKFFRTIIRSDGAAKSVRTLAL